MLPSGPAYCHVFISIVPILIQSLITSKFCNYETLLFLSWPSPYALVSCSLVFPFLSAVHIMSPALSNPFSCTSLSRKLGPPRCDPSWLLVPPSCSLCSGRTRSSPHTYPPQPACGILFASSGMPLLFFLKYIFKYLFIYLPCWVSLWRTGSWILDVECGILSCAMGNV